MHDDEYMNYIEGYLRKLEKLSGLLVQAGMSNSRKAIEVDAMIRVTKHLRDEYIDSIHRSFNTTCSVFEIQLAPYEETR